jgi:hypothetical protein
MDLHHHTPHPETPGPGFYLSIILALLGKLIGSIDWDHAQIPPIIMQSLQAVAFLCPVGILYFTYKSHKKK